MEVIARYRVGPAASRSEPRSTDKVLDNIPVESNGVLYAECVTCALIAEPERRFNRDLAGQGAVVIRKTSKLRRQPEYSH